MSNLFLVMEVCMKQNHCIVFLLRSAYTNSSMSYWELYFYSRLLLCMCNSWELECLLGYSTGSQATSWLMKLVYSIHHLKGTLWIFWINKNGLLNHFSFSLAEWFSRVSMEGFFFNALGSVQRFATKISWNTNCQYRLDKLHLCTAFR